MNSKDTQYPDVHIYSKILKSQFLQRLRLAFFFADAVLILISDIANAAQRIFTRDSDTGTRKDVLIVFNLALGDAVLFLAAAGAFRKLFPKEQYNLSITCQTQYEVLFGDIFDTVIPLDFVKGCVSPIQRFKNYKKLRSYRFETVIDPVGCADCTTNIFTANAARGREKIGILENSIVKYPCPEWIRKSIYTKIYRIPECNLHRIPFYLKLPELMQGKSIPAKAYTFPAYKSSTASSVTGERYFIVFPSASLTAKQWSKENFAEIAEKIYVRLHIPLMLCGTEKDAQSLSEFQKLLKAHIPVRNLAGKTGVKDFIEIIGNAACVVTNDTSVLHIAVAKNVPAFVLAGGFSYSRFARYEGVDCMKPTLIYHKAECFDCNNYCKFTFEKTYPCIEDISQEYAWSIIEPELVKIQERSGNA